MLFNSIDFIIFFPLVALGYFLLPKKMKNYWLLIASYYFYMCWNAKYALLMLFSTLVTWISGLMISAIDTRGGYTDNKKKKLKNIAVALSFTLNLAVLFLFKYFNFAIENINLVLSSLHLTLIQPRFSLLLPVGISFYTFQALSYTMDVYRKEIGAEKNFFRYALFVSFFPQLVAGPIERSSNLLRQFQEEHPFSFENLKQGLLLMLWGYFQKLVLADRIAVIVDTVYGNVNMYAGVYFAVASILFAFQIYCDFSGYSLIAIGAARVMGFQLMENFDCPYLSGSVAGFWRRWHISLTSWFRDYLYIPLGGNRKGRLRKELNIMIVFLVSGLWHGAAWTYVIWGGLNGLFQVIGARLMPLRGRVKRFLHVQEQSFGHRLFKILVTFILVDLTWIFFRADTIGEALYVIRSIFTTFNPWVLFDGSFLKLGLDLPDILVMLAALGVLLFADIMKEHKIVVRDLISNQTFFLRWFIYDAAVLSVLVFGIWGTGYDAQAFVYFQF